MNNDTRIRIEILQREIKRLKRKLVRKKTEFENQIFHFKVLVQFYNRERKMLNAEINEKETLIEMYEKSLDNPSGRTTNEPKQKKS